jgi:YHS domain-containing protein
VAIRPRPERSPAGEAGPVVIGEAIDPVCGMTVATVDTSLHLEHEGRTVWFCGSGCLRAFAHNATAFISVQARIGQPEGTGTPRPLLRLCRQPRETA